MLVLLTIISDYELIVCVIKYFTILYSKLANDENKKGTNLLKNGIRRELMKFVVLFEELKKW